VRESTFGMGCFWEPSEEMSKVEGVLGTVAGYTGNPDASENGGGMVPSYEAVCSGKNNNKWVEGVRVTYDDDVISYGQLLEEFFEKQKPQIGSRQYASIIFPHDEEQMEAAKAWQSRNTGRRARKDDGFRAEWTAIEPLTRFYRAEEYHQNYWQKQRPRWMVLLCLLAVASGIMNPVVPPAYQHTVASVANAATLATAFYITAERFLDTKVVEI
jgi:peptide-methionine (S)-S-oxide reductase